MTTPKEIILAKREGYIQCFNDANAALGPREFLDSIMDRAAGIDTKLSVKGGIEAYAAEKYPLTVSVPRIRDIVLLPSVDHLEFSVRQGRVVWRRVCEGEGWGDDTFSRFGFAAEKQPALLKLWADLLEQPTEERPAEEEPAAGDPKLSRTAQAIAALVAAAGKKGISRERLAPMLYMADVLAREYLGHPITDIEWTAEMLVVADDKSLYRELCDRDTVRRTSPL